MKVQKGGLGTKGHECDSTRRVTLSFCVIIIHPLKSFIVND